MQIWKYSYYLLNQPSNVSIIISITVSSDTREDCRRIASERIIDMIKEPNQIEFDSSKLLREF